MLAVYPLGFAAVLLCAGLYGLLARRNAVLVLMSLELMLAAATLTSAVAGGLVGDPLLTGQVLALLVIALAAAEIGVGLAIVLLLFRNRGSASVDRADLLRG